MQYAEYISFSKYRSEKLYGQTFTMATIRIGEEFTFQSPNSEDIQDLVDFFLDGLKRRSNYVISLQDYKPPSNIFLICRCIAMDL